MQWHSINIGSTTPELRQMLARRAEFYFNADHEQVLELIDRKSGYIIHPSTLVENYQWTKYKAIRILEEIADAFQLPRVMIRSHHGEAEIYMWGKAITSQAWPVIAWEVDGQWVDAPPAVSYSPVTPPVPHPVPVPAPTPAPAPVPAPPVTDLEAAARRALEGTKLSKIEAAKGLISYGIKELGMTAEAAADTLILMSRSESVGLSRATLREWVSTPEPQPAAPEDRVTAGNAAARCELMDLAAARPDLAPFTAVLDGLLDHKNVSTGALFVETWAGKFQGIVGEYTPQQAYAAVAACAERGALALDDIASELSARTRMPMGV